MTVDEAGLGKRVATDSARGDLFGGGQVLLHQGVGDGEDVADVVEAVAGIVGGELFGGAEIDAEQVADGVGVPEEQSPLVVHDIRARGFDGSP